MQKSKVGFSVKLFAELRQSAFESLLDSNGLGSCFYCARKVSRFEKLRSARRATLDHRVPRSHGGSHSLDNLVIACGPCNSRKGSLSEERFRQMRKRLGW
ncbi:MAG: HNH endonuclease [Proteobacteria bacterium]|nr:MAG: HNH endonuclease [Pseudomonadota bacterium]